MCVRKTWNEYKTYVYLPVFSIVNGIIVQSVGQLFKKKLFLFGFEFV